MVMFRPKQGVAVQLLLYKKEIPLSSILRHADLTWSFPMLR